VGFEPHQQHVRLDDVGRLLEILAVGELEAVEILEDGKLLQRPDRFPAKEPSGTDL
jgi:hypothetical protein